MTLAMSIPNALTQSWLFSVLQKTKDILLSKSMTLFSTVSNSSRIVKNIEAP